MVEKIEKAKEEAGVERTQWKRTGGVKGQEEERLSEELEKRIGKKTEMT